MVVEGFDLAAQALFRPAELRHAKSEFVQRHQVLLVSYQQPLHGRRGAAQFLLQVRPLGRRRRALMLLLQTAIELATDEGRVRHQARDVLPNESVQVVLTDRMVVANPSASALAGGEAAGATIVDVPAATSIDLWGSEVGVAAASARDQSLQ